MDINNIEASEYFVHVYETKDGHTATFNWYKVDNKTGSIISEELTSKTKLGTITGKLCYPSEVLPKGRIEAKRISDGYIQWQEYPGSLNGGKAFYLFQLEENEYYIRYKVSDNLIGYSTTVCPTGKETSCGDTNQRILTKAMIKAGQTVSNYDLCDFYYNEKNTPKF